MLSFPATTDGSCTSVGIIAASMNCISVACWLSRTRSMQLKTRSAMVHASRPGRSALAKGSHLARCDLAAAKKLTALRRHPSTVSAGPSLRTYHHLGAEPSSLAQVCSSVILQATLHALLSSHPTSNLTAVYLVLWMSMLHLLHVEGMINIRATGQSPDCAAHCRCFRPRSALIRDDICPSASCQPLWAL